jgi:hypothetical protein
VNPEFFREGAKIIKKLIGFFVASDRRAPSLSRVVVCLTLFSGIVWQARAEPTGSCLPAGIKEDSVVEVRTRMTVTGPVKQKVTVRHILKKLKAQCRKGNLIDRAGKPIRFYRLIGCWGTPPENYRQILEKQRKEIDSLKKRNTVIEISCNPDPLLPPA